MKLTEEETELIQAIRNFKKSQHNYSFEFEMWVRELFERLLQSN